MDIEVVVALEDNRRKMGRKVQVLIGEVQDIEAFVEWGETFLAEDHGRRVKLPCLHTVPCLHTHPWLPSASASSSGAAGGQAASCCGCLHQ